MPHSLYWPITHGSTARNAYVGHGALHGTAAVTATLCGMGGPRGSIDEWARVALSIPSLPPMQPPGTWLIPDGYLKPYPAVRHVHYGVVAAEAWLEAQPVPNPAAIDGITLHIYQEALTYCGNRAPATAIQAQFSLTYGLAHTLLHGPLSPTAYTRASLADPAVQRLEAMVDLRPDTALTNAGRRGCTLEVRTADAPWQHTVEAVAGDPGHRMTQAAVRAKFMAYATPVIGPTWAASIAAAVLDGPLEAPFQLHGPAA